MEGFNIKEILPIGFILPFILIILFEIIILYGLDFYNQRLSQEIAKLESDLQAKEEALTKNIEANEAYYRFSQVANIVEIVKHRKLLADIILKFNQLMPKFLVVNQFTFDAEKNEITIDASVNSFEDFARFYQYLSQLKELEIKSLQSPKLRENKVNFSLVLYLKPEFFKK